MKKIISIFLFFAMISYFGFSYAQNMVKVAGYNIQQGNMNLNYTTSSGTTPTNTQIKIGDKEYKIKSIKTLKETNLPQSYVFLVDTSGSLTNQETQYIKDIMKKIVSKIGKSDSVSIYTFDSDVKEYMQVTKDMNMIEQKISQIYADGGNTNLFASVEDVLGKMVASDDTNIRKNLIILSDGIEDYAKGKIPEEIYKSIEKSGIPIYSISLANERWIYEENKAFVSFANKSPGGIGIFALEDGIDATANKVIDSANNSYVANLDLSLFEKTSNQTEISINIEESKSKGSRIIDQVDVDKIAKQIKSTTKLDEAEQKNAINNPATINDKKESKSNNGSLLPIILGCFTAIVAGIGVYLATKNSPKGLELSLVDTQNPKNTKTKKMKKQITVGRDGSNDFAYSSDSMLSSKHCIIYQEDSVVFVKDLKSTNGTYVNGIKVNGTAKLRKNDTLLIGTMELKVIF